jgi:hypothetical protein
MHNTRVSSTQLPSMTELLDILKQESQRRAVRFDFVKNNNSIFDMHRKLSQLAGSDDSWLDTYRVDSLAVLKEKVDKNYSELMEYIQKNQNHVDLYKSFYSALILEEDQAKSDTLFVFGASTNARIERAVELFKADVADRIIISGRSPYYVEGMQSEASRMAAFAVDRGISMESLILEEDSITLPDNVKRTIDLLESMDWRPSSITIIATNFVLARATMEWYKFCTWEITVRPVAAHPQSLKFTEDGWYKDADSIALVLNEYSKIVLESKIDLMRRDGEID